MQTSVQFSETNTKYHNERQRTAVVILPGKGRIELALSDTQRVARSVESAKRTMKNIAGGAIDEAEADVAGVALHEYCRRMLGMQGDPEPRRS